MGAAGVLGGMLGGKLLGGGASYLDKIFSGNLALLVVNFQGDATEKQTAASSQTADVLGGAGGGAATGQKDKQLILKVPINPNEITLDSASQQVVEETETDLCTGRTVKNQTQFATTHLTVTLEFDNMLSSQCFQDNALDFLNPLGLVQSGVHALAGLAVTHTVRPQVEAMMALLQNRGSRKVTFRWSDFVFQGSVEAVQAVYTMFDNKGNPVRAKVLLRLEQVMTPSTCATLIGDYQKAFNWKYNVADKFLGAVGI